MTPSQPLPHRVSCFFTASSFLTPEPSWCLREDSNLHRLGKNQVRFRLRHGGKHHGGWGRRKRG